MHLEEDAGKLLHGAGGSSVDLNRTGTPLAEIVSEPDLRTPAEARAYLELLRLTLLYLGVSDCNMEEGSLRCDANISVRLKGETKLGVKNEIKNMNSFRGAEAALGLVERELQASLEAGEKIQQVTWGYSVEQNRIFKMRTKEEANDYRYFPDPDLPPVSVERTWVEKLRSAQPELPRAKEARFRTELSLSPEDAGQLVQEPRLANYFESLVQAGAPGKEAANWTLNEVGKAMDFKSEAEFGVAPAALVELIALTAERTINMPTARTIFGRLAEGEASSPREIVAREGLAQVSDTGPLKAALEAAVAENPQAAADIAAGKPATAMFFVGKVMQAMKGQADPAAVAGVIAERFGIDPALLQKKKKK